ncbi:MAG TPA: HAD hydrolase family protein [Candidatus Paceibacterota bacterium]
MRIVIDLDGTICALRKGGETYSTVRPLPGAIEKLKALKQEGHYLIIYTARHMKTCNGDIKKVLEKMETITRDWLAEHAVPFDELVFGKPYGDLYIDDLAYTFTTWEDVDLDKTVNRLKTKGNDS